MNLIILLDNKFNIIVRLEILHLLYNFIVIADEGNLKICSDNSRIKIHKYFRNL